MTLMPNRRLACALMLTALLAACGGGGGGDSAPAPVAPAPPPTPVVEKPATRAEAMAFIHGRR